MKNLESRLKKLEKENVKNKNYLIHVGDINDVEMKKLSEKGIIRITLIPVNGRDTDEIKEMRKREFKEIIK